MSASSPGTSPARPGWPTIRSDWRLRSPICWSRPEPRGFTMTVQVGVNGFGRIGRSFYRALLARGADAGVELVAVNDPMGDSATMAFLLKHDSVGGTLHHEVKANDAGFSVDGHEVRKLEVL